MPDGVLVINADRLVVLRNAAAARIMPECASREPPFPMAELASPDVREIVSVVLDAPGGFMILTREIRLGEQVFMVNVSPILEPDGATSGVVAVFSDITGIKKLETAKSMFVSMVAHEVKNPLAAAEGLAEPGADGRGEGRPGRGAPDARACHGAHAHAAGHGERAAEPHGDRDRPVPAPPHLTGSRGGGRPRSWRRTGRRRPGSG